MVRGSIQVQEKLSMVKSIVSKHSMKIFNALLGPGGVAPLLWCGEQRSVLGGENDFHYSTRAKLAGFLAPFLSTYVEYVVLLCF